MNPRPPSPHDPFDAQGDRDVPADRSRSGLQWDETHPEEAPWVHAREHVAEPQPAGGPPGSEEPAAHPDPPSRRELEHLRDEVASRHAAVVRLLDQRVLTQLEELQRRVMDLERRLGGS